MTDDNSADPAVDEASMSVEPGSEPQRLESSADADLFEEYPFDEKPPKEDPFEEIDVDAEVLGDDVFAALADEEQPAALSDAPDVESAGEGVVVPKRSYCEGCPHFTAPPAVECTNPGTIIHELVDPDHFRVSNCPVVADRRTVDSVGEE